MSHIVSSTIGFVVGLMVAGHLTLADDSPDIIFADTFDYQAPWLTIGVPADGDVCVVNVEIWPTRWQPTLEWGQSKDCTFGEVIIHD